MVPSSAKPEQEARAKIDAALQDAGWIIQDRDAINLYAAAGVAIREFPLKPGHGFADYLLFVDARPVGVLEAKPSGHTLSGVEIQSGKYAAGLPENLNPPLSPLPFLYESNGVETRFTNLLDPDPRSRVVFSIHRPETFAEWMSADTLDTWVKSGGFFTAADDTKPSTLRSRMRAMPPVDRGFLYPNQQRAVVNLEHSLAQDRPRSLIQMATGSGKTIMAVTAAYRLIKYGGARRVLFLVDRGNLGEQAEKEFQNFRTPDDNRRFTELYKVQRLTTNHIGDSTKVAITTIQRLYSMLKGEPEYDPEMEEESRWSMGDAAAREPLPVVYNEGYPPEFFDVIFVDECHRSIYTLWRQVLEYFDAYLIGLTATPAKHTFGFFHQNLVMEYRHEEAVADGVNVDFEVYNIRTQITEQGAVVKAEDGTMLGYRNRKTRALRWQSLDNAMVYGANELDRAVVAKDQIRLIARTFRDRLFTDLFPGRREVPKTLVFAKDDSHAEDIVDIFREEFGRGNSFCQKITYKTTGKKPSDLIQDFRNSYDPRIAVTVDMIATGTDIKPVEIVIFMRAVASRVLFEQMKGRGVRVIDANELRAVTPDAASKTHFVIVDCIGTVDHDLSDTQPLERKKSISLKALLDHVAMGGTDPDMLSSLASRLARLHKECGPEEKQRVKEIADGQDLGILSRGIIEALDPDRHLIRAREKFGLAVNQQPDDAQMDQAMKELLRESAKPLAANPPVRALIIELKAQLEQIIDEVSQDRLLSAEISDQAKEKARAMTESFETYIHEHKDEIDALQFFYSQPYARRLHYQDIKALADAIKMPPRSWTPEVLWHAYETLEKDKVRGASSGRLLTDMVSLVRFALHQQNELIPYAEQVRERFGNWLAQQNHRLSVSQIHWLEMMRDHIATSLEMEIDDFDYAPFAEEGGLGRATQVFGKDLPTLLQELNKVLAA